MFVRTVKLAVVTAMLCVLSGIWVQLSAQQAKQKPASQPAPAKPVVAADDAAKKAEILDSPQWRRVMFEFKQWLSVQQLYDEQQVAEIQDRFNRRVAAMTAGEVEFLLKDMQAKFQTLNSPEAVEARAWLGSYLSVMSDRKRAEVLKDFPKMGTMTAAQLQKELIRIQQKRSTIDQKQGAFRSSQEALVSNQLEQNRSTQQALASARNRSPATTFSPYHSPSDVNDRLNQGRVGPRTSFSVGPLGGVRTYFSSGSW